MGIGEKINKWLFPKEIWEVRKISSSSRKTQFYAAEKTKLT
jgi:hypothetical protein